MKRPHLDGESESFSWWLNLLGRCIVSCIFVLLAQAALVLVPLSLPTSTLFLHLPVSASVLISFLGFGRSVRRFLGINGSAPAFVAFNMLFMWGVYLGAIRKAVSGLMDFLFSLQAILLVIGLFRLSTPPPPSPSLSSLICKEGLLLSGSFYNAMAVSCSRIQALSNVNPVARVSLLRDLDLESKMRLYTSVYVISMMPAFCIAVVSMDSLEFCVFSMLVPMPCSLYQSSI